MGKRLGRPKFSDGERPKLRTVLDTGESRHAVSIATKMSYSTVKKHARALGYKPRQHRRKPTAAVTETRKTNFSGLLTLKEALALRRASSE